MLIPQTQPVSYVWLCSCSCCTVDVNENNGCLAHAVVLSQTRHMLIVRQTYAGYIQIVQFHYAHQNDFQYGHIVKFDTQAFLLLRLSELIQLCKLLWRKQLLLVFSFTQMWGKKKKSKNERVSQGDAIKLLCPCCSELNVVLWLWAGPIIGI